MKRIPSIKTVMTAFPYAIEPGATVNEALEIMRDHGIHHLPVTEDGELTGMVSSRDIQLVVARQNGAEDIKVGDVMSKDTFTVDLSERLDSVLHRMAEHHLRAVVVTRKGKLVGIFTQIDACAKFAEYMREQVRRSGGDTAA
ncbi:MAG: CBS domain-containing protein [Gammaproteobacteria bacterium]